MLGKNTQQMSIAAIADSNARMSEGNEEKGAGFGKDMPGGGLESIHNFLEQDQTK